MATSWESFEDSSSSESGSPRVGGGDGGGGGSFLSNSSSSDNSVTSPKSAHSDGFYSGSIYSDGDFLVLVVDGVPQQLVLVENGSHFACRPKSHCNATPNHHSEG